MIVFFCEVKYEVIQMKGGITASIIEAELRREKIYKQKLVRQKCYIEGKKQCMNCRYQKYCTDLEVKDKVGDSI